MHGMAAEHNGGEMHTGPLPLGYPESPRPEPLPELVAGVAWVPTPPRGALVSAGAMVYVFSELKG